MILWKTQTITIQRHQDERGLGEWDLSGLNEYGLAGWEPVGMSVQGMQMHVLMKKDAGQQ